MDDPSLPKSKRGAFQPRGDLQNRSPEDDDNVSDELQRAVVTKPSHSNPPLPPSSNTMTTTKKKANYLPVKSSGYGRASPSVKIMPASSSSSSISSSIRLKLRHGDGSLAGALDKKKTRRSASRSSLLSINTITTTTDNNNNINSNRSRSRSASPAVRRMRSRSPSPAAVKEQHQQHRGWNNKNKRHRFDDNSSDDVTTANNSNGMAMKKQKKKQQETTSSFGSNKSSSSAFAVVPSKQPFASPESSSSSSNNNANKKYHAADFTSQNIDIDPTPVKAAKKLLRDARKRATAVDPTPLSPLIQSPVMAEKEDCDLKMMKDNGAAPLLVQQQQSNKNMSSIFTELHPNISQTQSLSDNLFSIQSGIASTSILSLIKSKKKKSTTTTTAASSLTATTVDRSTTPSELRRRLERREEELKTLKIICNDLLQGKDEFVSGAVGIEMTLRQKILGVQTAFGLLGEEKEILTTKLNDANDTILKLQEEVECLRHERDMANVKCNVLQEDWDGTKTNLESLQQSYTNSCVQLALLESKVEETKSQLEEARSEVIEAQSSTENAVAEAKDEISKEINVLQKKNETLVAAVKGREMEICRMMSVDLESADFDDGTSFLNAVQTKVEEYQHNANTTNEVQNELERLKTEFEQSKAELGVSNCV